MPAFIVVTAVFAGARLLAIEPWVNPGVDLHAFWATRDGVDYSIAAGSPGAYLYSPAFAQLIRPLTLLPWPTFAGVWTALLAAVLLWLGGRAAILLVLLPPVAMSIGFGQPDLLMAAAIVVGFRYPAAWAFPILTKATPGVGLLWFLVRREWGSLAVAIGATAAITLVSVVLDPGGWIGWLELLRNSRAPGPEAGLFLPVPLWLSLSASAAIVVWGALTDRRWALAVGTALSMPILWITALTVLVALLPLLGYGPAAPLVGSNPRWPASQRGIRMHPSASDGAS